MPLKVVLISNAKQCRSNIYYATFEIIKMANFTTVRLHEI